MKLRDRLMQFMAGRNGLDRLGRALNILTLVLLVLSFFGISFAWFLAIACLIWGTFRTYSRNIPRRQAENAAYLRLTSKIRTPVGNALNRFRQRKDYRFFVCPSCKTRLRVPRGKGTLNITCRQCGERFQRKT